MVTDSVEDDGFAHAFSRRFDMTALALSRPFLRENSTNPAFRG